MAVGADDLEAVLARHAGPDGSASTQLGLLSRLPAAKRALVERRIRAVDEFVRARKQGTADPKAAADAMKVSIRSMYRLVARVAEMGAVGALAPTPGAGRRTRADAAANVSDLVDQKIAGALALRPGRPLAEVVEAVRAIDATVSDTAIRRRAMFWRAKFRPSQDARFGRAWLFDQATVDLPVLRGGRVAWLTAGLLLDVDTGLVVGRHVARDARDPALATLLHALGRIHAVLPTRLEIAKEVEKITWILPDGFAGEAAAIVVRGSRMFPPIDVEAVGEGRYRRGVELVRHLGERLGPVDILVRTRAGARASERMGRTEPLDEARALAALDAGIVMANRGVSEWAVATGGSGRAGERRRRALRHVADRLLHLFAPVLSEDARLSAAATVQRIGER